MIVVEGRVDDVHLEPEQREDRLREVRVHARSPCGRPSAMNSFGRVARVGGHDHRPLRLDLRRDERGGGLVDAARGAARWRAKAAAASAATSSDACGDGANGR